ncbi:putative nuclease HARBI1 [Orchesella cincta]|uniref:Putative nuclease HARBI1 n=1 Tax=Orchesella cincta TaxID=48709 RepID=A0A1D2M6H1_ORCCI|nr:putative nuclease HARBI1 [Orchesella cincta]
MAPISSSIDLDDDILIIALAARRVMKASKESKKRNLPRFWVNDYLKERRSKGRFFTDFADMRKTPTVFKENFRMNPERFDVLHELVREKLQPHAETRPDDSITSDERLAVTLEFLASGTLLRHLASCYRISKQHLGKIIEETCDAIISALSKESLPYFTEVANRYNERWNMPNCIGSIDGKHCAIKCPGKLAAYFIITNLVLMGVADADYKFMYFDVGAYGSEGDSGVFKNCEFGKALNEKRLDLPPSRIVHGKLIPLYFVADDAFPLAKHIQKPFKPPSKYKTLPEDERIFNYRLSRARRTIENAFGILCVRWLCLARTMFVGPDRAQKVITACCLLHNYLTTVDKNEYVPQGFSDTVLENGSMLMGTGALAFPLILCFAMKKASRLEEGCPKTLN